jgi:7-carboxy-7-deazaguanine synthase
MIKINEVFYSIQGESSFAGRPCAFVRLTGCNLRCSYCDTSYSFYDGKNLEVSEIIQRVKSYECALVEVTGGEPLIQPGTPELVDRLIEEDFDVLIETNGSKDINVVSDRCTRIVDIKCPSSGEERGNDFENLTRLTNRDEVKFVIGNRTDYEYARKIVLLPAFRMFSGPIHFSPVFPEMQPGILAEWILGDRLHRVNLHLQLHKIIWGQNENGTKGRG